MKIFDAALRYARAGHKVFPCAGKVPATPNGFYDATTDEATITAWFENSDYNIAMVPGDSGFLVVDVDTNADPYLVANLEPTRTIRTPSGGFHHYYRTNEKFGNKKLAANIDIRNVAGYVLVPPSPGYVMVDPREPAPLPSWIAEKLRNGSSTHSQVIQFSDFVSHNHLVRLLEKIDPGCGYDEWTRVLAAISAVNPDFDLDLADIAKSWSLGAFWDGGRPANAIDDDYDMDAKLATFSHTKEHLADIRTLHNLAAGVEDMYRGPPKGIEAPNYTAEAWCVRDIETPARLIGPINSTSRVMLHAQTGIGKTHFAMAIAAALASGDGLLHWEVPQAAKVLYIDGEMPQGLMQERVIEMKARVSELGGRMILLSHADIQFEPLNTKRGQEMVQEWIDWFKPDLTIFDNIQALTSGDLKETESWRGVQEWCRSLGAHMWVHHSNKDGSAYGDKSREWQFDTVISLLAAEGEESDLTFDLIFRKHRELHPNKNGPMYQEGRFALRPGGWSFVAKQDIEADELIELLSDEGPLKISEVAKAIGKSIATVKLLAKGKWLRYVIPGSKPVRLGLA